LVLDHSSWPVPDEAASQQGKGEAMKFGDVRTVEELIDALQHFDGDMDVEVLVNAECSCALAKSDTRHIDTIEVGPRNDYDVTPIVKVVLRESL
jgi:hypothetical protein